MSENKKLSSHKTHNGRKYRMGLVSILAITASFAGAALGGVPAALLATFVGGVLGVYGTYCGMNIGSKYIVTRATAQEPVMED